MRKIILTGIVAFGFAAPGYAQVSNDQMEMAYNSARNQLGLLKYCQNAGHIDGDAVDIQTKMIALIPAPSDTAKGDEAQQEGEKGKISANPEISSIVPSRKR